MPEKRAMVFVDAQNITHAAEDFYGKPKQLDPAYLVDFFTDKYDLIRPYWFDSHPPESYPQNFYHFLKMEGGYRVTSKGLRERNDGYVEKGVDIELATELIAQGFNDSYDVAVIISGDTDYEKAIRYVQDQGKRVVAATFENNASGELKGLVDEFIDLGEHSRELRRDD